MFKCGRCKKGYSSRGNLTKHQKNTKACLALEEDDANDEFECGSCEKILTSQQNLNAHSLVCKQKDKNLIKSLENELVIKETELTVKNSEITEMKIKLEEKNKENDRLSNLLKEFIHKPTNIINNTNTNSNNTNTNQVKNEDNRVLNVVTFLKEINKPITTKLLEDNVKHLTVHHCLGGGIGLADYALQFPLAETPIVCTDQNRHNFKYLDEFNGRVIVNEDKNLIQFNPRFFAAIKERSRVLLEEFAKDIDITDDEGLAKATEIANILKDINYSSRGDKTKISDDLVTRIATKTPFSVVMKMLNNQPRIEAAQTVTNTSTVEII